MKKQQKWSGVKAKKTEDTLSKAERVAAIIGLFMSFGIIVVIVALVKMILGV